MGLKRIDLCSAFVRKFNKRQLQNHQNQNNHQNHSSDYCRSIVWTVILMIYLIHRCSSILVGGIEKLIYVQHLLGNSINDNFSKSPNQNNHQNHSSDYCRSIVWTVILMIIWFHRCSSILVGGIERIDFMFSICWENQSMMTSQNHQNQNNHQNHSSRLLPFNCLNCDFVDLFDFTDVHLIRCSRICP